MSQAPKSNKARLFVGAKVSLATVNALNDAVRELSQRAADAGVNVRWVTPATYHVTLKFIGWTRPEVVDAIRDRVAETIAGTAPFDFDTRGMGAFPKPERARVVWAGISNPGEQLTTMANRIDTALADLGFPAETRAYHPHVTLGRLREPKSVESVLEPYSEHLFSKTSVESVVLYESKMKSTGSEYEIRHEWPLEARS